MMAESILQYLLPTIVSMLFALIAIELVLKNQKKTEALRYLSLRGEETIRVKLAALERMILFMDRVHPLVMASNLYQPNMNVADLQLACIQQTKAEFNHNLPQMIYIDSDLWEQIRNAKEESMAFVAECAALRRPDVSAKELLQELAIQLSKINAIVPTEVAKRSIQQHAQEILNTKLS